MRQFQQLMRASLLAGTLAGIFLFVYQYVVIVPRIIAAEAFEAARTEGDHHGQSEWKPGDGWEPNAFTAASTVLTGIGFASVLLSVVNLAGFRLTIRTGLLWGLGAFACFTLAPALGLPPEPPGVPVADVRARQLWWVLAVGVTAIGIVLIFRSRHRVLQTVGAVLLLLPHAIGAPEAMGPQVIPAAFLREFALASILGNGLFFLVLGALAGLFYPNGHAPVARNPSVQR